MLLDAVVRQIEVPTDWRFAARMAQLFCLDCVGVSLALRSDAI